MPTLRRSAVKRRAAARASAAMAAAAGATAREARREQVATAEQRQAMAPAFTGEWVKDGQRSSRHAIPLLSSPYVCVQITVCVCVCPTQQTTT